MVRIVPSYSLHFYCLPDSVQFNSINLSLASEVVGTEENEIRCGPHHHGTSWSNECNSISKENFMCNMVKEIMEVGKNRVV